jgi:hypothetical protein
MIKFFRKIRQNLLSEGKTTKYLKYALGEIVLVVIGILIALQINNWNENRKASNLEQAYYCLLLEDIEQDKEQIKSLIEINEKRIQHSNEAIAIIQSKNIDLNVFGEKVNLSRRDGVQSFIPNSSTYEDIKSSGNINTLRDNNIRKSLNQYYRKTQELNGVILTNMGLVFSRMTQTADWFNIGSLHPSKEIFPKEIQDKLKDDLPVDIPNSTKSRLYEDLVLEGVLLRRRTELLKFIENEVDIMNSQMTQQCKSRDK